MVERHDGSGEQPTQHANLRHFEVDLRPNVEVPLRYSLGRIEGAAKRLRSNVPDLLHAEGQELEEVLTRVMLDLGTSSLLPPDHHHWEPLYGVITDTLTDTSTDPKEKFIAAVVSDALIHQTSLPLREKEFYINFRRFYPAGIKKNNLQGAYNYLAADETTEESQQAFSDMRAATDTYLSEIERDASPQNKEDRLRLLNGLDSRQRTQDSLIGEMIDATCSPELRERVAAANKNVYDTLDGVSSLLISGELDNTSSFLRYQFWMRDMWDTDILDKDGLSHYFLRDKEVQSLYWDGASASEVQRVSRVSEKVPERMSHVSAFYGPAEFFMLQDQAELVRFLQTFPTSGDKVSDRRRLDSLIGMVATFQTLHHDHPNVSLLQRSIAELAREQKNLKKVQPSLDILADKEPGVITLEKHGVEVLPLMRDQRVEDLLRNNTSLLYESKATPAPVVREVRSVEGQPEILPQEPVLVLAAGEPSRLVPWPEVQRPHPDDIPRILSHLATRLDNREPDEEGLLELATQETPSKPSQERAALVTTLLEENHELVVLSRTGIVSVQQEGEQLSFLIDTRRSGIVTEGLPFVVLHGEKDTAGEVHISGAGQDFDGTLLQLALTGAALITCKEPVGGEKVGRKVTERIEQIPGIVTEWNRNNRGNGYPQLSAAAPDRDEMAVVVPVSKTDVVHLTMPDVSVK